MACRHKWALGLGVIAVVTVVASLMTRRSRSADSSLSSPCRATRRSSRRAPHGARSASSTRFAASGNATGTLGLLYETLFRYDPLSDKYIPWLATDGKWVGRTYVVTSAPGREVERRQAVHRPGRQVHVRDGQARGLGALHDVEDRSLEDRRQGQHGQLRLLRAGRTTSTGTPTSTRGASFRSTCGRTTAPRTSRPGNTDKYMVGTGPFTYGAGKGTSGTLQWNRRSNWWATKALGMKMPMQYSSTSTTPRTPPRCRTSSRTTST